MFQVGDKVKISWYAKKTTVVLIQATSDNGWIARFKDGSKNWIPHESIVSTLPQMTDIKLDCSYADFLAGKCIPTPLIKRKEGIPLAE